MDDYKDWHKQHWHGWGRQARRGDMRLIVLHVLQDKPMHGYEIIRYLEDKSHGFWRPSAGSIYPTLQMLEEADLIVGRDVDGKKVYELTDTGRAEVKVSPMQEHWHKFEKVGHMQELRSVGMEIMMQLKQIVRSQSKPDSDKALEILTKTRDELAKITRQPE